MSAISTQQSVRFLDESNVREVLRPERLVELMQSVLAAFSAGEVVNPPRTVLFAGSDSAYVGIMPAFLPVEQALGTKLVTAFTHNRQRGLPSHFATIVLLDPTTGALRAIIDGRFITEMRTAAVSAVACRFLAPRPIRRVAILGAGVQARGHVALLDATLPLEEILYWSPGKGGEGLMSEGRPRHAAVVRAASAEEAVRKADAVVLVTDSSEPVLQRSWVRPGTLVVSVGACRPDHRELDPALLSTGWLIVDSRRSALTESGDVIQGIAEQRFGPDHIQGELGEVVLGRIPPRRSSDDVVIFKSLGLAVEDVAVGNLVLQLAEKRDLGRKVTF